MPTLLAFCAIKRKMVRGLLFHGLSMKGRCVFGIGNEKGRKESEFGSYARCLGPFLCLIVET